MNSASAMFNTVSLDSSLPTLLRLPQGTRRGRENRKQRRETLTKLEMQTTTLTSGQFRANLKHYTNEGAIYAGVKPIAHACTPDTLISIQLATSHFTQITNFAATTTPPSHQRQKVQAG